jgi:hypothetical protein
LAGQLQLAKTSGLNLVALPDELPLISNFYQNNGKVVELCDLLEAGVEHP